MDMAIRYDPQGRQFAMVLDGEVIGFARTAHDATRTAWKTSTHAIGKLQSSTRGSMDIAAIRRKVTRNMPFVRSESRNHRQ